MFVQVVAAQAVQKRLTTCDEARSKTLSTQRALTVKMQSKSGVTRYACCWLIGWLAGWLVDWLCGWVVKYVGWLVGWVVG